MADEIIIETTSQEVIEVGVPGPQGPAGAAGTGLETLTTQGDTLFRGAVTGERLAIGTPGQILKVSAQGIPSWANESGAVTSVAGKTGVVTLDKNDVGLGNVDNTSDSSKPVSTATQTALNGKAASSHSHAITDVTGLQTALDGKQASGSYAAASHTHTPSEVGLGNVSNTAQVTSITGTAPIVSSGGTTPAISISAATTSAAGSMSSADKTKLDAIAAGATANSSDATLLARANHTGTQAVGTITGLGGAATLSVGTTTGTVAAGDDSRFHTRSHAMTGTSDHTASNWSVFYSNGSGRVTELGLGAANTVLTSNGASSAPSFAAAASGGTKTYAVFTAEHNQPPATAFATLDTRNSIAVLDFDAATDENAVFVGIMPEAASLGSGLIVRLHWMATTATSGNVRWGVQFERSNTDLDSDSFDTAVEATAAANGTSGIITTTAITVTTIDNITAGDVFRLKVFRNADDATNDTMTGDAELVAVEVRSAA